MKLLGGGRSCIEEPRKTPFRGHPALLAALLCILFGLGVLTGSLLQRSRSADCVVLAAGEKAAIAPAAEAALVDLNHADAEALTALDGIGPALAARIVAYREEHGPFRYCYELMNVTGIGEKTYEKIKNCLTTG